MEERIAHINALNLVGGRLCLDFTNTVGSHDAEHSDERLTSYQDLLVWSRHAGVLDQQAHAQLEQSAAAEPETAAAIYTQAFSLRETMFRIFSAVADKRPAAAADLAHFNLMLHKVMAHVELVQTEEGFGWDWAPDAEADLNALDRVLWPIVRSATELLTSGDLGRVRECSSHTCEWLFVDTSRNRSRRWCDMEDCGNRAKARRHYHRKRAADQTEA